MTTDVQIRPIDNIKADLALVTNRLKENRQKIRDMHGMHPATFNKVTDEIRKDVEAQDRLLAELSGALAWQDLLQ